MYFSKISQGKSEEEQAGRTSPAPDWDVSWSWSNHGNVIGTGGGAGKLTDGTEQKAQRQTSHDGACQSGGERRNWKKIILHSENWIPLHTDTKKKKNHLPIDDWKNKNKL